MLKLLIKHLWREIEPLVDNQITDRIVTYHRALIRRGQIPYPPPCSVDTPEYYTANCKKGDAGQ